MLPPTPKVFVLLIALLPVVWLSGSALAERVARDRSFARLLTPALALSLWLLSIHIASLIASSFWIALPAGTLVVAAAGAISRLRPAPALSSGEKCPWMWISALAATAYVAPTALGWWFHDELFVTGHLSIVAQIENGIYPPRHLSFPEFELRYHYGFDLLVAAVASILRLRADHAIDLVTLFAWGYSWCLAWAIGERLVARGWGGVTAAVVLFGGGMAFFSPGRTLVEHLLGFGAVGSDDLNPTVVSYFFQHPWTLGVPLGLATILAVAERDVPARAARLGAIGLLLVALSLCQTVLYLCLTGTLLLAEPLAEAKIEWKSALRPLLVLVGALFIASRLHGFFVSPPAGSENMLELRSLPLGGSLGGWASWHLETFGLLLPLGVVGLFFLARERVLMSLLVVGGLLVLNSLRYRWSWDIVKFATVASLALSFGASAALQRLFELRPQPLGRAVGALAAAGLLAAGLLFPLVIGSHVRGIPFERQVPVALSVADGQAVDWLRQNIRPGEIVYRRGETGLGYAQWGGLPQLLGEEQAEHFPLPRRIFPERARFLATPVSEPEMLLRHRVRWLVLDPGDERLARLAERWTVEGRAAVRARFGPLTIVEILGEVPSP
jgi:hypothetical protein